MPTKLSRLLLILCLLWFSTAAEAYTTTTNYGFKNPQVNNAIDQNQWGTLINSNFTSLDSLLLTATNYVATSVSTNTVLTNTNQNQLIKVNAASAPVTITLQAAATAGSGFRVSIKKTDATGNTVTIAGNAAELIDLANTQALTGQNATITIICDGTQWWIVPYVPQVSVPTASTSVAGILQLATNAQTQAGSNSTAAVTPASLASIATAGSNGKIVLGTVTLQWFTTSASVGTFTASFPTSFSSAAYNITCTGLETAGRDSYISVTNGTVTSAGFSAVGQDNGNMYCIAIGPT